MKIILNDKNLRIKSLLIIIFFSVYSLYNYFHLKINTFISKFDSFIIYIYNISIFTFDLNKASSYLLYNVFF